MKQRTNFKEKASARKTTMVEIGFGKAEITPPHPQPMAGFGKARTACHKGVHDPISVRVAYFRSKKESIVLISCELIGLKADIIARIREALPTTSDLKPEGIIISCTHTHGGPVINEDYIPFLIRQMITAVQCAQADLRPGTISLGRAVHDEWTGFNRRYLETGFLPVDREATAMFVNEPDGKVRGILFHYACHPSILGPDNLRITADWPGYAIQKLQERYGADVATLFFQGTSGDINTGYSAGVSSLGIPIPSRTFETAQRVGEIVARTVLAASETAILSFNSTIRLASAMVRLNYRDTTNLKKLCATEREWARRVEELEQNGAPSNQITHAKVEHAYARFEVSEVEDVLAKGKPSTHAEQTAFCIGDAAFLTFPGEFFVESGLCLKREATEDIVFPLGITNDYLGYFPLESAFKEGGYEVACAPFAPSTADNWVREGLNQLGKIIP